MASSVPPDSPSAAARRPHGQRPLTWQQIVIVVLIALMPFGAMMAFDMSPDTRDAWRPVGRIALVVLTALILMALTSHGLAHWRADREVDLLEGLFPMNPILQAGDAHFVIRVAQVGPWLLLRIVVQNVRDGDGKFAVRFAPKGDARGFRSHAMPCGARRVADMLPPLTCGVPGAGIVMAELAVPLQSTMSPGRHQTFIEVAARSRGRRIRFARRNAVTRQTHPLVTALALMGGHAVFGGGTHFDVDITPFEPMALPADAPPRVWELKTLWTPQQPAHPRDILQTLGETASAS